MKKKRWGLGALCLLLMFLAWTAWERSRPVLDRSSLTAALGGRRLIEARLTGGFAYAPCELVAETGRLIPRSRCSEPLTAGSPEITTLKQIIPPRGEISRGSVADQLQLNGLALLLGGKRDQATLRRAVETFEEAVRKTPSDAKAVSDLAAARFTLAEREDEPVELIRALTDVRKALRIDPSLPEARFNHALILHRLYLRDQARTAWRSYLEIDPKSAWAGEVQMHLAHLKEPVRSDLWEQRQLELHAAVLRGDTLTIREIVSLSPQDARERAMEKLLGTWGDLLLQDRRKAAAETLAAARAIGKALLALTGENSISGAVYAIDRATNEEREKDLHSLAQGHAAYRDGNAALQQQLADRAATLLARAREKLTRGGSPAETWARLGLAGVNLHSSRYDVAIRQYQDLVEDGGAERSWALQGKAEWGIGLAHIRQGNYSEALTHYRAAAAHFERVRESHNHGFVRKLIAENLHFIGQRTAAWRYRFQAAAALYPYRNSVRLHSLLWEGGWAAVEDGEPEAGLALLHECVELAERSGLPQWLAEALLWRSKIYLALSELAAAQDDLEKAQRANLLVAEEQLQERLGADLAYVEGEVRRRLAPNSAVPAFTKALDFYRRKGLHIDLAGALLGRFRAALAAGQAKEGENDLSEAIELFESRRDRLTDSGSRLSYSEAAQSLYDEMILLQADQNGDSEAAWDYSERARTVAFAPPTAAFSSVPERLLDSLAEIPEDLAVVEYARVQDRLFSWIIWKGRIESFSQEIDEERLEGRVRQFLSAIVRKAPEGKVEALAKSLYGLLIPSFVTKLPAEVELCFVPDKILNAVPFAALRNPRTGQYLIEERAIRIAPNASLIRPQRSHVSGNSSALLVGATVFDRTLFPDLPPLPGAVAETASLAALYGAPVVMQGTEATKERILAELDRHEVFHLAGHSVFNEQHPEHSYFVIAPSSETSDAGLLFVEDILDRRFERLRLVVLSACNSLGPMETRVGSISGLARPFLDAGVSEVVGSLWEVNDRAASHLIPEFHRRYLASGDAAQALRGAQLGMLRNSDSRLRRVDSWAVFQVASNLVH